jgi:hypothetical protein
MIYGALDRCQKNGMLHVINIRKKGNRNVCSSYRGISPLTMKYKLYAAILKAKLQLIAETVLTEEQCRFFKGRSCTDAVFTLNQKRRESSSCSKSTLFGL